MPSFAFDPSQSAQPKATTLFTVEGSPPLIKSRPYCVGYDPIELDTCQRSIVKRAEELTTMTRSIPPMRYLSVCSGIEAATVAWHHLGWTPVGFSEIEPFPSAVLAHHYPTVPNFGDMTKFREWPLKAGDVDLLVGGTPCQSFSVAGLRKGLDDPRGNLTLVYLGIVDHLRPRWVVWENVPGVLSDKTGAFQQFLDGLESLGYLVDFDICDAQFFGVPQRRKRVFVCGVDLHHSLKRTTTTSASITAKLLLETLHGILEDPALTAFASVRAPSGSPFPTFDGAKRRIESLSRLGDEATVLQTLQQNWAALVQLALRESSPSDSPDGEIELDRFSMPVGRFESFEEARLSMNTVPSWASFSADDWALMKSCITSTATSSTTDRITSLSSLALTIVALIARLSHSYRSFSNAASSALNFIERSTSYARRASKEVERGEEWVQFWADFSGQAADLVEPLQHLGDWECAATVLFEPESLRGDSPARGKARKGSPADAAGGAGGRGRKRAADGAGGAGGGTDGGGRGNGVTDLVASTPHVAVPRVPSHWDDPTAPHPTLGHGGMEQVGYSNQEIFSQRGAYLVQGEPKTFTAPATGQFVESGAGETQNAAFVAYGFYANEGSHGMGNNREISPSMKLGSGTGAVPPAVALCTTGERTHALPATAGRYSSEDGTGRGVPTIAQPVYGFDPTGSTVDAAEETMTTLRGSGIGGNAGHRAGVAYSEPIRFDPTQITHPENRSNPQPYTLEVRGRAGERVLEYRQDGTANCLRTPNGGRGGVMPAVAFNVYPGRPGEDAPAELRACETDIANTVTVTEHAKSTDRGTRVVQADASCDTVVNEGVRHGDAAKARSRQVLRALWAEVGPEAFTEWGLGILASFWPPEVLRAAVHGTSLRYPTFDEFRLVHYALSCPEDRARWAVQQVRSFCGPGRPSFGWEPHEQRSIELGSYLSQLSQPGASAATVMSDLLSADEGPGVLRQTLSAVQEVGRPAQSEKQPAHGSMVVRRLTARECEFLQGFPRDYTKIPWKGKPADVCPDGPRYKALGNSMAVPCMRWIGERIDQVERNLADAAAEPQ